MQLIGGRTIQQNVLLFYTASLAQFFACNRHQLLNKQHVALDDATAKCRVNRSHFALPA